MKKYDISEKFAKMWRKSRESAGKSQDYMAKALGVSKKTVQNWENGTSCPSQQMGFEWFMVLGIQPMPYYLKLLYPYEFDRFEPGANEKDVGIALLTLVSNLTVDQKRKLLYILQGCHGSSPICILEMLTAYLQTPLEYRLNIAASIAISYEVSESKDILNNPAHVQPNMSLLNLAIKRGRQAVIDGKGCYTIVLPNENEIGEKGKK